MTPGDVKTCRRCGITKARTEFYAVGAVCKECKRAEGRARYAANPEKKLAKAREWHAANRERVREAERKRYAANPEKYAEKRRREIESGRRAELVRNWRALNAERNTELTRAWREANRKRLRELGRQQYAANPSKYIERAARRRALTEGAAAEVVDIESLWTGTCGICDQRMTADLPYPHPLSRSIDHIVPLSRGGAHVASNLQWAHLFCNVSKGARVPG